MGVRVQREGARERERDVWKGDCLLVQTESVGL